MSTTKATNKTEKITALVEFEVTSNEFASLSEDDVVEVITGDVGGTRGIITEINPDLMPRMEQVQRAISALASSYFPTHEYEKLSSFSVEWSQSRKSHRKSHRDPPEPNVCVNQDKRDSMTEEEFRGLVDVVKDFALNLPIEAMTYVSYHGSLELASLHAIRKNNRFEVEFED